MNIVTAIAIAALLSSIGLAVDKLLLNRHKKSIQDSVLHAWVRLADTNIRDISKISIRFLLRQEEKLFGRSLFSVKRIIISSIVSVFLLDIMGNLDLDTLSH